MCRAHRYFVAATVTLWGVLLALIALAPPDGHWKMVTILTGCLSVVMLPYCLFPWLVSDMMDVKMKDIAGAYIAGWEAAQGDDPREPARKHLAAVR